jgi:hypothetical protein
MATLYPVEGVKRRALPEMPIDSDQGAASPPSTPMSADARLQERPIGKTILPRSRRTAELPLLSISHVPTRSRRCSALSHNMRRTAIVLSILQLLEREAPRTENVAPSRLES